MQVYLGNVLIASDEDEVKLARLPKGVEYSRIGSMIQLYGPGEYRQAFTKTSMFRGEVWFAPKRDRVVLLKDSQRILALLASRVTEELKGMEIPDVKLNGVVTNGSGHSLEITDTFRNVSLRAQVSSDPDDSKNWVTWRVSEIFPQYREILTEKVIPYPLETFDDARMWEKAVNALMREVKSWLKGRE